MPRIKFSVPFTDRSVNLDLYFSDKPQFQHQSWIENRDYDKVFVIGDNKTGTTSLAHLFSEWGFEVGDQWLAQILGLYWLRSGDPTDIINYCQTAEVFQDVPFSKNDLFKHLDRAFPKSKFVLTVRNDEHEWFESLVRFHTKVLSSNKSSPPSPDDLRRDRWPILGYPYEIQKIVYGLSDDSEFYNESIYKAAYLRNNQEKRNYFKDRPNDFLEINLSRSGDFFRLCEFLKIETDATQFPHLNRS